MKTKTYFHFPALFLLAASFFGASSVVNAGFSSPSLNPKMIKLAYTLCVQGGNREACALYYELLIPKLDFPIPICDPRYCDPIKLFDKSKIDPDVLRDKLVDTIDQLEQQIIELDKMPH